MLGGDIRYPSTTKIIGKYKKKQKTEVRKTKRKKKNETEDKWPGGWGHELRHTAHRIRVAPDIRTTEWDQLRQQHR